MKKMSAWLIVLVMVFGIVGCSTDSKTEPKTETEQSSSEETVGDAKAEEITELRLYTYYADTDVAIVDQAVERIEAKYPVEIEIIHRTDATGIELKTMAAIGKLPDIFEVSGETVINSFLESGDIAPLEDVMKANGVMEDVNPTTLEALMNPDGHTYAMNFAEPRNFLIYYNQAVFDEYGLELPQNYEDMLHVTKVLTENGVIPFALFGAQPWPGIQLFDTIATRHNPGGIKGLMAGDAEITDDAFVKTTEQITELMDAGFIGKSAFSTNASQAFELFKTGKAAMIGNGTWYLLDIAEYGEGFGFLDNPFAVPGEETATLYNRSGGSSQGGWTVNPNGDHVALSQEIAVEYCKQRVIASIELFGTPNPFTFDVPTEVERHPAMEKYSELIPKFETTTYFAKNIPNPVIATAFNDYNQALLAGAMSSEEFIDAMKEVIDGNK